MPKAAPLSENALARIVDEATAICEVPAPTFAESQRAALVQELLTTAGLAAQIDAAGNVVARVGGDGPALALVAHLDTVFPGLTTITQPEGCPFPLPIRVSAGFFVMGLSGNKRTHTFPFLFI